MRKDDYIKRIDGVSIYCITSSEGKYVYAVRCSTHSISEPCKKLKKDELRKLTQLVIPLTKQLYGILKTCKKVNLPCTIQLSKTKFNNRILTEEPDLLTFKTTQRGTKVLYTFTYKILGLSDDYIYITLKKWINKICR